MTPWLDLRQIDICLGRLRGHARKRLPARPRSKWLGQIRSAYSLSSPADLWRCAVCRGHCGLTRRSQLTTRWRRRPSRTSCHAAGRLHEDYGRQLLISDAEVEVAANLCVYSTEHVDYRRLITCVKQPSLKIQIRVIYITLSHGIRPVKTWVVGCWRGYLSGARCRLAYGPADATATHCFLLQ